MLLLLVVPKTTIDLLMIFAGVIEEAGMQNCIWIVTQRGVVIGAVVLRLASAPLSHHVLMPRLTETTAVKRFLARYSRLDLSGRARRITVVVAVVVSSTITK